MKTNLKKLALSVLAVASITGSTFAQFKGEIRFTKTAGSIDVEYTYLVKGDQVRVEEIGDEGKPEGIQLMNLKDKKVYALSPDRKLYMEAPNRRPAAEIKVDVKKTGKTKEILGKKCTEIIVTSKELDRKIVYWVTKGDYDFFIPMLQTLNRKENQSMFFLLIPGMEGFFPMLSTEYSLSTGKVITELKAEKVTVKDIAADQFEIPAGYTKFER